MNKKIKSMVKALKKLGMNLKVKGLEMPVGERHLITLIDGRNRLASRGKTIRKPQPRGRQALVIRQKKARPAS